MTYKRILPIAGGLAGLLFYRSKVDNLMLGYLLYNSVITYDYIFGEQCLPKSSLKPVKKPSSEKTKSLLASMNS